MFEPIRRLALVPEPHPGESLLSWVDAIAHDNRVNRMQALRLAGFVRPNSPGNRPPTHFGSHLASDNAERVFSATGLPPEQLHQMTLLSYAGGVLPPAPDPPLTPQRVSSWLARHRIALPTNSRACPACLRENGGRWLLRWRLVWSFACVRHRVYLLGTCRGCGERLHQTTPGPGGPVVCRQMTWKRQRLGPCPRIIPRMRTQRIEDEHLLAVQRRLDTLIDNPHRPGGRDILGTLHGALDSIRIHYDDAPPLPDTDPALHRRWHGHQGALWFWNDPLLTAALTKIVTAGGLPSDATRELADTASWSETGPQWHGADATIPVAGNRFGGPCRETACPTWIPPGQGSVIPSATGPRMLCAKHTARATTRAQPQPLTSTGWCTTPETDFLRARLAEQLQAGDPADELRDPLLDGCRLILDACERTDTRSREGRALRYAVRSLLLAYAHHPDFEPAWLPRAGEHPTEALGQPSQPTP
ncbi:DUF6221 family protein [Streptomyces sp. MUSC 125]|uniref:DUF6221 family protein n=1 Tax=Streptomyces sp. MUSC 125 TaxID=1428624 RepID=UPI000B1A9BDF|nr:DUF6221 family protein [Streptomyces sp. MUSC 125]